MVQAVALTLIIKLWQLFCSFFLGESKIVENLAMKNRSLITKEK